MPRKVIDEIIRTDKTFPTQFGRDNMAKHINATLMFSGKKIHKSGIYRVRIEKLTEEEFEAGTWKKK